VRLSLQPSLDPSAYHYTHTLRTRFAETDAMGIIHHGAYPTYLEEARAAMLRDAGHPYEEVRSAADGVDFAVLELYVRYRQPLRFGDEVQIHVVVDRVTRTTFQVGYLLEVDGAVRSTAVTVHGAVDGAGRPARLPGFLADLVATGSAG
jgi:acyl-CoA thioester hydrolase